MFLRKNMVDTCTILSGVVIWMLPTWTCSIFDSSIFDCAILDVNNEFVKTGLFKPIYSKFYWNPWMGQHFVVLSFDGDTESCNRWHYGHNLLDNTHPEPWFAMPSVFTTKQVMVADGTIRNISWYALALVRLIEKPLHGPCYISKALAHLTEPPVINHLGACCMSTYNCIFPVLARSRWIRLFELMCERCVLQNYPLHASYGNMWLEQTIQ